MKENLKNSLKTKVKVEYIPYNIMQIMSYAGRTCYNSHAVAKTTASEFIAKLIKSGHESVIEHGYMIISFDKKDISYGTLYKFCNDEMPCGDTMVVSSVEHKNRIYMSINMRSLRYALKYLRDNVLTEYIIQDALYSVPTCIYFDLIRSVSCTKHFDDENYVEFDRSRRLHLLTDTGEANEVIRKFIGIFGRDDIYKLAVLLRFTIVGVLARWEATQMNRSRALSISAESLRYVNMNKGDVNNGDQSKFRILYPEVLKNHTMNFRLGGDDPVVKQMNYLDIVSLIKAYSQSADKVIKNEDIRNLYPLSTMNPVVYTASIKGWNGIFKVRISKGAQESLRNFIISLYRILNSGSDMGKLLMPLDETQKKLMSEAPASTDDLMYTFRK